MSDTAAETETPAAVIPAADASTAPPVAPPASTPAPAPTPTPTPTPTIREAVEVARGAAERAAEAKAKAAAKLAEVEGDKPDPVAHMLKSLQEQNAQLTASLKSEQAARAKAEREAATRTAEHEALMKRVNESAIVGKLRDALPPGKSEIDIRGALAVLHEQGKVDRYAPDPEAATKAAVEALKASGSALLRADAPLGGPGGAPTQARPTAVRRPPI